MPQIQIQHVVSVSSEDKNFPADNLTRTDGYKKWKGKAGEKNVTVTLQFAKAEQIHQIDLGNENSAFIEVLVGTSSTKDDDFKVILVASSFMSPAEARNSQNGNRVRMFPKEKLSQAVADDKWDRVRVVCTQPFNKTVEYGLSFIKFHGPPGKGEELPQEPKGQPAPKLGAFALKTEDSYDDIKPGALFAKKEKGESVPLTGAAAMRAASKLADESGPSSTSQSSSGKRRHSSGDDKSSRQSTERPPLKKHSTSLSSVASSSSKEQTPLKRSKTEPPKQSKEKAFHKLMDKVIFVISGYQNPERGKMRDRALEMGAQYKADWGKGCTHLICAFEKTPKYSQVKGKGRIVTSDWIRDSYKAKKLMPWRKYRLGRAPSPGGSSSESDEDVPPAKKSRSTPSSASKQNTKTEEHTKAAEAYGAATDSEDTEDEVDRIQKAKATPSKNGNKATDIYDAPTDDEADEADSGIDDKNLPLPELPDFFNNRVFFLYGKWDPQERRSMVRYITAYNGSLEEYMSSNVTHVLTDAPWDDNFDQALSDNPNLHFVKPKWIHACYEKQKLLPHQKFVVVPS